MSEVREVIIIGSGPSGYTAAIYAARADLHPLIFEGAVEAGGALMNTTEVENFPGFPEGIMGPDLMGNLRAQAERFGAEIVTDDIVEVDLTGVIKSVTDSAGGVHHAKAVILAMGSGYRRLGVPGEDELSGRGVSWCATCDGFFFRDKAIAVIGGGDSALEEATFLSRFASSVTVVHRRDELRASKIMIARAEADPKISFAWNSRVVSLNGNPSLTSITLADTTTGEERDLEVQGCFIAIGHDPDPLWCRGRSTSTPPVTCWCSPVPPTPTCPACSPPATWSTTPTGRPSRRPAPGARPLWTPSATWQTSKAWPT